MTERLARNESVEHGRRFRWRWSRVLIAVVVCTVGFFVLVKFDVRIGRAAVPIENLKEDGFADQIIEGFKNFPQPLTIAVACLLVGLLDKRRKRIIIALLAAQLGANVTYAATKFVVRRDRPYIAVPRLADQPDATGMDAWRGFSPGNISRDYQSFPSGHSAAAFALAGVLAWYYPRAAAVFWILAVGAATSRVLYLAHWPSDCIAGAGLGYLWSLAGLFVCRKR